VFYGFLYVPAQAEDYNNLLQKLAPSTMQVQYAGNLGLASLGIGKTFAKGKIVSYIIYGYLPKQINGVEVQTLALKTTRQLKKIDWHGNFTTYTGLDLICGFTHNSYIYFPKYFPKSYYDFPIALHAAPLIGESFSWRTKEGKKIHYGAFLEISTLDYYLIDYFKNIRSMDFTNLWSLSFGLNYLF